jgi:GT2 family glycosyltransferase
VNLIGPAGFHARGSVVSEPVGRRTYHERVGRRREGDCRECESLAEVDAGSGTCMMYSRAVALELGGYDPGWAPVWFDDIDLALSIRRSGLKAFFTPDVRLVHHVGQRTAGRDESRAVAELRRLAAARLPPRTRQRIAAALRMDQRPPEVR